MQMRLIMLVLAVMLVSPTLSIPYSKFIDIRNQCNGGKIYNDAGNGPCEYNFFTNIIGDRKVCAKDLARSKICETTFDDCD